MPTPPDVQGSAALAICEALLLALNDRNVLPEREIMGILQDAAGAHGNVPAKDDAKGTHAAAAVLIQRIIDGGNSVRRK